MSERYFCATLRLLIGHGTSVRAEFRDVVFRVEDDKDVARNAAGAAFAEFQKRSESKALFIRGHDARGLRYASAVEIAEYELRNSPGGSDLPLAIPSISDPLHEQAESLSEMASPEVSSKKRASK